MLRRFTTVLLTAIVFFEAAPVLRAAFPAVLTRAEWGADESYLFDGNASSSSSDADRAKGDLGTAQAQPGNRIKECQESLRKYPDEFGINSTVKKDARGRLYKWPLQYSRDVRLLVVHHTGLIVRGDPRSPLERVRSLYKSHAVSRGWGDIGYNYVIDETGQIYEGRTGGKGVVAGHVYCNNVGTIGIVLMGNFEIEVPSQAQVKSLQWLLQDLAGTYRIDLGRPVQFHGKKFDAPIVSHRDLLPTLDPGYFMNAAFSQIIANVRSGNVSAPVLFPSLPAEVRSSRSSAGSAGTAEGISFTGRTSITINPGGKQRLSFAYTAGLEGTYEGKRIAEVSLSSPEIRLWVDDGIARIPVTRGILLPNDLPSYETLGIQLIVQAPTEPGTYWMDIAGLHFTLSVAGRRAKTGEYINPFSGNQSPVVLPAERKTSTSLRLQTAARRLGRKEGSSQGSAMSSATSASAETSGKTIRIRLSASPGPTVTFADAGTMNGAKMAAGTAVQLLPKGSRCQALVRGETKLEENVIRLQSAVSNILTVDSVRGAVRSSVGVMECRVLDGSLTLINELPMENYLAGLSEEPDSEPYEKQRAFAIAARTYAAYYLQDTQRKFPGKPYDGSDDPAIFQAYAGIEWGGDNPRWLQAAASTAGQVLMMDAQLIKPPYFTSDDGRTRSPLEAGWGNFPFAVVFQSKPDPWCTGLPMRGHGVGMSGCGARGQAIAGRSAEQILQYYYPGVRIVEWQ